ncbi:MAG: penicillin acylase family protein [Verrucomicrobia bacterium]|nr:penicillin acylase family protein [Verrucomicrobiota bacterium]
MMTRFIPILLLALEAGSLSHSRAASESEALKDRARSVRAQTAGSIRVPGLQRPVTVLRDPWGVAHIFAQTQPDLFFAQGFVAAQDRLWQLELWRRAGEGKLSEILGPKAVERDRFARLLRYRGDLNQEFESYAPDGREIIEAFVRGVNFFIESSRGKLPIEFQLAGITPELWTPEVCVTRLAGYVMTRNATMEVVRARLIRELGVEAVEEILPTDPPQRLRIPAGLNLEGIDESVLRGANAVGVPVRFDPTEGSNNWVVDGTLSATGKPLLANDPHRPILLPSLRYMVHLVGPGWNVIGSGEPALPGVAIGHNENIGFGITIFGIDQQDLYVEETNPQNPNEYRRQGRWEPMRVERELIKVEGLAMPVQLELKFTIHGPVIHADTNRHRAYALRWVGSEPGSAGYLASLSVDRARNWTEFLHALERWKVPSLNFVYADSDGNIGWQVAGLAPARRGWAGLLPVPGAEGRYEWDGFLSLSQLPHSYNSPRHFLASANNNLIPPRYRHQLGHDFAAPFRYQRIDQVLSSGKGRFTLSDFERLQHDETSMPARELVRLLREVKGANAELQRHIDLLTKWDCVVSKDFAAAALFEIWWPKIGPVVFKPRLPEKAWPLLAGRLSAVKTLQVLKQPTPRWFGSNPRSSRDAILLNTLSEAVAEANSKLGHDPQKWRWGTLHKAAFPHTLSTDETRRALFDLGPVERGGDSFTVNMTGGSNFKQDNGASYRQLLDLAEWDRSLAVNVPGQSGQPQSQHYDDLLALWAEGRYYPLLFSRTKIEEAAQEKLILEPGR